MNHRIKILYVALIALAIYTLWPSSTDDKKSGVYAWNLKTDAQGNVEVFGVKIGEHTLLQAEEILKSRSDRALFLPTDKDTQTPPTLEAYFRQMPDNSKLILGLNADDATLSQLKTRAHSPMAFPSGNIKLELADQDMKRVDQIKVRMITYVPRIRISPQDIYNRFGQPEELWVADNVYHYLYPDKGLDAILDESGEGVIQFVAPKEFSHVIEHLRATAKKVSPVAGGSEAKP